jgi:hypothetical protein
MYVLYTDKKISIKYCVLDLHVHELFYLNLPATAQMKHRQYN